MSGIDFIKPENVIFETDFKDGVGSWGEPYTYGDTRGHISWRKHMGLPHAMGIQAQGGGEAEAVLWLHQQLLEAGQKIGIETWLGFSKTAIISSAPALLGFKVEVVHEFTDAQADGYKRYAGTMYWVSQDKKLYYQKQDQTYDLINPVFTLDNIGQITGDSRGPLVWNKLVFGVDFKAKKYMFARLNAKSADLSDKTLGCGASSYDPTQFHVGITALHRAAATQKVATVFVGKVKVFRL